MISTETVTEVCRMYAENCQAHNKQPTFRGMGLLLGVSGGTIRHVVTGYYKGNKLYTDKPHIKRCISNSDFKAIKSVFDYL